MTTRGHDIAVIGMSGRFPGANSVNEFWNNLIEQKESISFFDESTLNESGVPSKDYKQEGFVNAWGALDDIDLFDAGYFGISPREAQLMDPQHRIFLETAVHALEDAGCDPKGFDGYIAVFAGAGPNSYLIKNLLGRRDTMEEDDVALFIGNDKDFVPTRTSYKLGLRGPSMSIATGCSTSLVSIHMACRSLLTYQTDVALAGAVNIKLPQKVGYQYKQGSIYSQDGHCRAFDAEASGTIFGNGAGIVVLKRLDEALEDGDHIYAVVKGSAINNDGDSKAGYTAPSTSGEANVVAEALEIAQVEPEDISFLESHGTGTQLGDPIEVSALKKVFPHQEKRQYCALGAVKTNIGHLDGTSGAAGFIKTVLALHHKIIPANLHFEKPNPEIDFENSAFYIPIQTQAWETVKERLAGISSFGVGGTNAHAILGEAPIREASDPAPTKVLLTVSAKTVEALNTSCDNLARFLETHPNLNMADVAFSLQTGRTAHGQRKAVLCSSQQEAIDLLREASPYVFTADDAAQCTDAAFEALCDTLRKDPNNEEALILLARSWAGGGDHRFDGLYKNLRRQRIPLPLYPFQRQRYWVEPASKTNSDKEARTGLDEWTYLPTWTARPLCRKLPESDRTVLVLGHGRHLANSLVSHLRAAKVLTLYATPGESFEALSPHDFKVARTQASLEALLSHIQNQDWVLDQIVFIQPEPTGSMEAQFRSILDDGLNLAKALGVVNEPIQLIAISEDLFDVNGTESLNPAQAALLGPLRVLPQEMPHVTTTLIDISADSLHKHEAQLVAEVLAPISERTVALRGNRRWQQSLEAYPTPRPEMSAVQPGGTYVITGGLGGIGLELAGHLAEKEAGYLYLTSRKTLPPQDEWTTLRKDHPQADLVTSLLKLKTKLIGLEIVSVDVSDEVGMAHLFKGILDQRGTINGVIHSAGSSDKGPMLTKTQAQIDAVLATKLQGTLVLQKLLEDHRPDFVLYCSSMASHLGGIGQAAYCAANNFLDAFAIQQQSRQGRNTCSINWDSWAEVGMAANLDLPEELRSWQEDRLERLGIRPEEGKTLFEMALDTGLPNLAISTHDLTQRLTDKNQVVTQAMNDALAKGRGKRQLHPRPALSTPYAPAETALEKHMTPLWENALGISGIGIHDDFFELGGDSLNGMNMINQLQQDLGETIHVNMLFDAPSIALSAALFCREYPAAVSKLTGEAIDVAEKEAAARVTVDMVKQMRAEMPQIHDLDLDVLEDACENAVFVLAPPRSGSTLLRVMLGGHPNLFAPPEPLLFSFNNLGRRAKAFESDPFWLEGVTQAVKEATGMSADEAAARMRSFEEQGTSITDFFNWFQSQMGDRQLVDKTPSYAYEPQTLQRIEKMFKRARFIHLTRHPYAMIRSYEEARMDVQIRARFNRPLDLSSRQVAEMIYTICHENIRDFLATIPAERQMRVSFEDLVSQPGSEAERICSFLGLPMDERMLDPYAERGDLMTGGLHDESRMLGDIKFHQHKGIDSRVADSWRDAYGEDFLGAPAMEVANWLGYEAIDYKKSEESRSEAGPDMDAFDLLDQLDGLDEAQLEALLAEHSV